MGEAGKACSSCGIWKPLDEFHRDAKRRDGQKKACKRCANMYVQEYYKAHRQERLAYSRKYHREHPALRAKQNEYSKRYYQEHREKKKEYSRRYRRHYYQEHREERAAYSRRHYREQSEEQRDRKKEYQRQRRKTHGTWWMRNKDKPGVRERMYERTKQWNAEHLK